MQSVYFMQARLSWVVAWWLVDVRGVIYFLIACQVRFEPFTGVMLNASLSSGLLPMIYTSWLGGRHSLLVAAWRVEHSLLLAVNQLIGNHSKCIV